LLLDCFLVLVVRVIVRRMEVVVLVVAGARVVDDGVRGGGSRVEGRSGCVVVVCSLISQSVLKNMVVGRNAY
jgi:hypothetical protein